MRKSLIEAKKKIKFLEASNAELTRVNQIYKAKHAKIKQKRGELLQFYKE
jgi:hypothetical protein